MLDRRSFLRYGLGLGGLLSLGLPLSLPRLYGDEPLLAAPAGGQRGRKLILIELRGGNDGLNTVVPIADPAYRIARPNLALAAADCHALDRGLALHPELAPLLGAWNAGDMAVALGVGYPAPNRSHFRSWDIWHAASASDEVVADGWLATSQAGMPLNGRSAHAIAVGNAGMGPAVGGGITAVVLDNPERFVRQGGQVPQRELQTANPALSHVLAVEAAIAAAAAELGAILKTSPEPKAKFPNSPFGRSLAVTARLILGGCNCPAWVAGLGGFDTHSNQKPRHATLMRELGAGLGALREALRAGGAWDDCLIMTTSEFGRRVAENGSGGSDHGTAAPHFILGGQVQGGLLGTQPSLTDLERGDLKATQDFRGLLRTAAEQWLGLPAPWAGDVVPTSGFLRS